MAAVCLPCTLHSAGNTEEIKEHSTMPTSMEDAKPTLTGGDTSSLGGGHDGGRKDATLLGAPESMKGDNLASHDRPGFLREEDSAFSNVPNEILIQILEHIVDDEQIFKLALLSRRLHHVALPFFLSRKACGARPSDQLITSNYNAHDAFRAIRAALFRPALARLYFAIDCRKTDAELRAEIDVLVRALEKLSALREMVLGFQNTSSVPSEPVEGYGFPGGVTSATMGVLLDAVLAAGCQSIVVRHCGSQSAALQYLGASLEQAHGGVRSLPERLIQIIIETMIPPPLPEVKNHNLTVFRLHSPMALHPHLYQWTLDTLNHSAIETLSISQQQCVDPRVWELVLPRIYIPALINLSIDFVSVDISTLFAFLNRHPLIQNMHITRNFIQPLPASPRFGSKALAELTHLKAPLHWINYLLSTPAALPSLASATALVHIPAGGNIIFTDLDASLKNSMARLEGLKDLHLSLSVGAASPDWLLSRPHATNNTLAQPDKRKALHGLVTQMDVSVKLYLLPAWLVTRLPAWLAQFPLLRRFELLMLSEKDPADAHGRAMLTRAIMRACPRIDSVRFGLIKDVNQ